MARGTSKQLIFEDDIDRNRFLNLLSEHADRNEINILAYCLMGDHVHLLLQDPCKKLSEAMKNMLASYATWFNLRHGRCGHLFQGRFKSEPIESDSYLLTAIRYIHKNPVAAGLADVNDWQSRNAALHTLKANGLGIRQIQRLTGISLSMISKA